MKFIIIMFCLALCISPFLRLFIKSIFKSIYYSLNDLYDYVVERKWRNWSKDWCGIHHYVAYFGHGKTLSITKKARDIYKRMKKYGKRVRIVSNYDLKDIPYIPLTSYKQIIEIGNIAASGHDEYEGTIILLDEIEFLFSHRGYSGKSGGAMISCLSTISQQRKAHVLCLSTSQRWAHVDACYRQMSLYCVDCTKFWRFQRLRYYDAWDIENATNRENVRCLKTKWWFVQNEDYKAYDTTKMISQSSAEDFISTDEMIVNRGIATLHDDNAVVRPSKKLQKARRANTTRKMR